MSFHFLSFLQVKLHIILTSFLAVSLILFWSSYLGLHACGEYVLTFNTEHYEGEIISLLCSHVKIKNFKTHQHLHIVGVERRKSYGLNIFVRFQVRVKNREGNLIFISNAAME